jgi:hypothetical protein
VNDEDRTRIAEIVDPVVGLRAWGAALGHGSFVTIEFGDPVPAVGKVHGAWHLWVYDCAWRIEIGAELVAGSADEREDLDKAVPRINGRALLGFVLRESVDARLRFEGDLVLSLFPHSSRDTDHWMLFTPEHKVLTLGPRTSWSYKKSDGSEG